MGYGLINGRNHWISEFEDEKYAIWWDSHHLNWMVGETIKLGSKTGYLSTATDKKCVYDIGFDWKYSNSGWHDAGMSCSVYCRD